MLNKKKFVKNHMYFIRNYIYIKELLKLKTKYYIRVIYFILFRRTNKLHYPKTLQYPITNKCNLNCIMCNIHANSTCNELSTTELKNVLSDKIFKKIKSVGINGGEPFVLKNLQEYVDVLVNSLPHLRSIYIISNGTIPSTTECLEKIKEICSKKNIKLTVSFSIDGYDTIHDKIRGHVGTFERLLETIKIIKKDKDKYCDNLNFICTISKQNVSYLQELEAFSDLNEMSITYNIATDHERLKNYNKHNDFSLFSDKKALMLAREFIYSKFKETHSKVYYSLFKYLNDNEHKRISDCSFLHDAITLTSVGDICYCATCSKVLGNVRELNNSIENVYFENQVYNKYIENNFCKSCSHYMGSLNNIAYKEYISEMVELYKAPKMKG